MSLINFYGGTPSWSFGGGLRRCHGAALAAMAWAVTDAGAQSTDLGSAPPRAAAPVSAAASGPASGSLPQITVVGRRGAGYTSDTASAGAKIDIPLRDVPQAVSVFDETLLRDLGVFNLSALADRVAGVAQSSGGATPFGSNYTIRGFDTGAGAAAINGFREFGFQTPRSRVNIDRVEFLKGPASVLYGGAFALSGLVNIVTKQPLAAPAASVDATFGSFGRRALEVDLGGPLAADGTVQYRLTGSVERGGAFTDAYDQGSRFISPNFRWAIDADTRLDVELAAQRVDYDGQLENGLFAAPVSLGLPVELNQSDPAFARGRDDMGSARIEFRHRFGSGVLLRQAVFLQNVDSDGTSVQPLGLQADGHTVDRRYRNAIGFQRDRSSQTELSGDWVVGGMRHQALAGLEVSSYRFGYKFLVAPFSPLDLQAPSYPGSLLGPIVEGFPPEEYGVLSTAIYLQDLITLAPQWKAMAGLRYDRSRSDYRPIDRAVAPYNEQTDKAVSPRVGVMWQPSESTSIYASATRSFSASFFGRGEGGVSFPPERGVGYEVGVKQTWLEGRLTGSAAVFQLTRENVLTTDPADPDFSIPIGEQRSRGLELELAGRPLAGLDMTASYTYLSATVTQGDDATPTGSRLGGVPRHAASLWGKLSLAGWSLPEWGVGSGLTYASSRPAALPDNGISLPSYLKLDLAAYWERGPWRAQLNANNVTDERIYDANNYSFKPRAPRNVALTVGYRF